MILYDRYQKKKVQQRWCELVSHVAQEPLDTRVMPRKVTVFLAAPPGDGLKAARDHFVEYVKPVLVAGALDWEVVEGRREGEVRAGLAERIRKLRRRVSDNELNAAEPSAEDVAEDVRRKSGVNEWSGVKGDIVLGRHTWREYVRGLHEGWLGPVDVPPSEEMPPSEEPHEISSQPAPETSQSTSSSDDASSPSTNPPAQTTTTSPSKPPKPPVPLPLINSDAYTSASLPSNIPETFEPSVPLPQPHVLGFFNTPIRIYRFLNRRHLADRLGRETAAIVLAAYIRPYDYDPDNSDPSSAAAAEIRSALEHEEKDWHKSIRQRKDDEGERVWLDEMVLDERIVGRMRRFALAAEDERQAERLARGKGGGEG